MGPRALVLLLIAACGSAPTESEPASDSAATGAPEAAPGAAPAPSAGAPSSHDGHGAGEADPNRVYEPACDEDNPVKGTTDGTIDAPLPDAILQFERRHHWDCTHREYHETRQWDYISSTPSQAPRLAYAEKQGWKRAAVQEGAPGSGLDFLAMHRAMLGTLRDRFPAHAALFVGWDKVPTTPTAEDPLPPTADGSPPQAFWPSMLDALTRLETNLQSFATEDDLGRYIETQHRPTPTDPLARSTERGSGVHTYLHVRFDDPRSPIRMQRFSRNLESQTFFRLHGWVDRVWTTWRASRGLDDATDAAYRQAMDHACMHMKLGAWDVARGSCT